MAWPVLRRATELTASSELRSTKLQFSGGEPLLARDLFIRALHLARRLEDSARPIDLRLMTNGLLLDDALIDVLDAFGVRVQLSFDGVEAAQGVRSPGSFRTLDQLVRRIREQRPRLVRERLRIAATVSSGTVAHLAESILYLVNLEVAEVSVTPVLHHDPGWTCQSTDLLDRELGTIRRWCAWSLEETGRLAFSPLRRHGNIDRPTKTADGPVCSVPACEHLTVDVDGRLAPCLLSARSYMPTPSSPLGRTLSNLNRGHIVDPWNLTTIARFVAAARKTGLFFGRQRLGEGGRPCGDCEYRDECRICPVSIAWIPKNSDPHRVPDHICAFNRTLAAHRKLMPEAPNGLDLLRGTAPVPRAVARLLGQTNKLH